MPERPTGTVTFLFTDIEGSTQLLRQLHDRYDEVLQTHARLIREAVERFDGHEIDTQGDAFFVVFARARDAVAAAVDLQRSFAAEAWPEGVKLRVRMGLHTGEPLVGGERYVGMGVNRGARICAAGHGGQVLLSNTTRDLVEDDLPDGVRVVDLGEQALKDLPRPERIFQLEIADLPESFPPLRSAAAPVAWQRRLRSRRVIGTAVAGGAVAAAVIVGLLVLGGASSASAAPNSVVALNPSGSISSVVPVGAQPAALTSGAGALWVANLGDRTVTRVNPVSGKTAPAIPVPSTPVGIAAMKDTVWVTSGSGAVSTIDPTYDVDQRKLPSVDLTPTGTSYAPTTEVPTLAAFSSIWVVDPDGYVSRIDPASERIRRVIVGNDPSAIARGDGFVWVANSSDGTVTRIDPTTLDATPFPVGHGPDAIAVNHAGVWVANAGDDTVVRLHPDTGAVAATYRVGNAPAALLATPTAIWVANSGDGTVTRLDPRSGERLGTQQIGGTPDALAFAGDRVWVAVAPAPPSTPATGGTAHLTAQNDPGPLDPAVDLNFQILYATCANLVTYPDKAGQAGSHVVPEVAEAIPTPTDGGRTYTFRIRPGFRFSPPKNTPVTAATFKSTIERVVNPRLKSFNAGFFNDIVGYAQYRAGKARGLSGVVARGNTLTIRLTHPDGGFLTNLALSTACAVPQRTPDQVLNTIPSAGPYYIKSYTPRQSLVLQRNPNYPNYPGHRPHVFSRFVYTIGVDPSRAVAEIDAGKADYATDGLPASAVTALAKKYGTRSRAAKAGHEQYFASEANGVRYLMLNTSRPLFASARMRRAVNYAIDRKALAAQERKFLFPVFGGGKANGDLFPPAALDARNFHVYPLTPDLKKAKRLAGHIHRKAVLYAATQAPWPQEAALIKRELKPLGIDVDVQTFPEGVFYQRLGLRPGAPFDLAVIGFGDGGTDPVELLDIFDGTTIGSPEGSDISYFDSAAYDRKLHAIDRLSGAKRYLKANRLAYRLERDEAPAAAIATGTSQDFFSARIGCQLYQPVYGMDLGALCVRPSKP
jgi:ABC-type transport system substrate-binding protein/class 3 adenylate cyclase/streptogramin lyase